MKNMGWLQVPPPNEAPLMVAGTTWFLVVGTTTGVLFPMSEVPLYLWMKRFGWWQVLLPGGEHEGYRGTSLIRNRSPPYDHHRALGIFLL